MRYINNQTTNDTRSRIADQNNDTRASIATGNNNTSEDNAATRAGATTDAATTRGNATVAAAGVRAAPKATPGTPTAGQMGVQNRFDQKRMDGIGKEELAYHATRLSVGALLGAGKDEKGADITPAARTLLQARYNNATEALQDTQFRKAAIMKTPRPPADVMSKIPEGQPATSPDGHVWAKKDGVVYLVK